MYQYGDMELSVIQTNNTKGVAILMMLCLHLFNTLDYQGLFSPSVFIGSKPLIYYISLFCDCCVAIYCFCSGYGLNVGYMGNTTNYNRKNYTRLIKLYLNYWIILLLFAVGLGMILGQGARYPGDWIKFFLNVTAIDPSYNGAWWFFTTYLILVLSSPLILGFVNRFNGSWIVIVSFLFYSIAYIQRIKVPIVLDNFVLDRFLSQLALLGTAQFPFVLGALAWRKKWYSQFIMLLSKIRLRNLILVGIILLSIVIHGIIPSLFIAVFTGVLFIFCFNALNLPAIADRPLQYLSVHSTNIWLVHMFFYLIFFKEFIYAPKYPILIYLWLLLWCLAASKLINVIYHPLLKWISLKKDR